MKLSILNFIVLSFVFSCIDKQEFPLKINFPEICNKEKCEAEIIFLKDKEILFSKKFDAHSKEVIDVPKKKNLNNAYVYLNIYINNQLQFISKGNLDKHRVLLPLPINASRIVGNLRKPRWAHSQILHPSGKVVITGGYRNIKNEESDYVEKDYEKKIELYNIYTNEIEYFPYDLISGKSFHRSYLLDDNRILLVDNKRDNNCEIIDLKKQKIEELKINGKNYFYLGSSKLYYESSERGYIFDLQTKKIIREIFDLTIDNKIPVPYKEKIFLIGDKPFVYDIHETSITLLKQDLVIRLQDSNYAHEVVDNNIFFIDQQIISSSIYYLNPDTFLIKEVAATFIDEWTGRAMSSINDNLVLTGDSFEVLDVSSDQYVRFNLLQKRSYHAMSRIENNLFFLSGGLTQEHSISDKLELFLFVGGDL